MRLSAAFLLMFLSFVSFGQDENWLEFRMKGGFLAAHRAIIAHVPTEHALAGEFSLYKQSRGGKAWHEAYHMPIYGISGFFGSVGNRELLGYYAGVYGFINYPFLRYKSYTLSGKMGAGMGYGTRVYDQETNIFSIPVSSHLNAMVCLALESRFTFDKSSIVLAADMTHFSNGAAKVPNLGLNLPYLSLGYSYQIKDGKSDSVIVHPEFKKYWEIGGIGIVSYKEVFPVGTGKHLVYALSFTGRRYFRRSVAAELAFDVISKQAVFAYQSDVPKTQADIIQLGIFAGYIIPMDRLHAVIGMGYYVRDMFQPEDALYHRVGLRYVFDNGININLVLKSHWARADYIEYGIGYTFKK